MDDVISRTTNLSSLIATAMQQLRIAEAADEHSHLVTCSQAADFWNDTQTAQQIMKQIGRLESRVQPWLQLERECAEIAELAALQDTSVHDDLVVQLETAESAYQELKAALRFGGQYDTHDAIVSIHAGAGGTDAQDWAQMLYRMYVRWGEAHGCDVVEIDQSAGEEAGIKSVTLEISGTYVYGQLKSEHGVHRLVRLSPFNADALRQTSFARVEVLPKVDQPDVVQIDEKDLRIDVYRAGGHGGQSVNTTDSAVRVTHVPTGIVVAIQNERSQLQNKETAMTILRSRLAQLQLEQHKAAVSELKGPTEQAAWGNQIRSYVLHPYKQVKDLRTRHESSDPDAVLDGALDPFIDAYLEHVMGQDQT